MFGIVRRPWATPQELRQAGVLGINRRNGEYVLPNNPRRHYPRVDDKALTKELCRRRQIPVPETYALIERHGDVPKFLELIGHRQQFVVKPAGGSEGRGILVIARHDGEDFYNSSDERLPLAEMTYHLTTILSGLYSSAAQPDRIIIEQRIIRHPVFESIAVGGTPDVRIVLYRCVPVMAMVRLPTRESRGRANLHQGAVAAGVHLAAGGPSAASARTAPSPSIPTPVSRSAACKSPSGKICSSPPCAWPMNCRWAIWASISCSTPSTDQSCWKPTLARD